MYVTETSGDFYLFFNFFFLKRNIDIKEILSCIVCYIYYNNWIWMVRIVLSLKDSITTSYINLWSLHNLNFKLSFNRTWALIDRFGISIGTTHFEKRLWP